eukprot:scaffold230666_cov32-Tisochrysis_lutea.AAC.4
MPAAQAVALSLASACALCSCCMLPNWPPNEGRLACEGIEWRWPREGRCGRVSRTHALLEISEALVACCTRACITSYWHTTSLCTMYNNALVELSLHLVLLYLVLGTWFIHPWLGTKVAFRRTCSGLVLD